MLKSNPFPAILTSFQKWHEEIAAYRDEVEDVGARAQEILDERRVSSRLGCQATQLTSRYQALLLQVLVRARAARCWVPARALHRPKCSSFHALPSGEDACLSRRALAGFFNSQFHFVSSFQRNK